MWPAVGRPRCSRRNTAFGFGVFTLFASRSYTALEIVRTARVNFSSMLAIGIGSLIFVEFDINVAMVPGDLSDGRDAAAIFLLCWLVDGDDLRLPRSFDCDRSG